MRIHEKKDSTSPHYRVECNYGIGRELGEDPDDVASSDSVLHEQGAECIRASAELVVSDVHTLLADRDSTPLPAPPLMTESSVANPSVRGPSAGTDPSLHPSRGCGGHRAHG